MRAFSTLELLVCIAIISLLISMTLFFRWDDTKKELEDNKRFNRQPLSCGWFASKIRLNQSTGSWEDSDGVMWMLSRKDNKVRKVGP